MGAGDLLCQSQERKGSFLPMPQGRGIQNPMFDEKHCKQWGNSLMKSDESHQKRSHRSRARHRVGKYQRARQRRRVFAIGLLAVLCCVGACWWWYGTMGSGTGQSSVVKGALHLGGIVPDFSLTQVSGSTFHLTQEQGQIVVLSFVCTQPDTTSGPSRTQAVVLTSIYQQYHTKNVAVLLIDSCVLLQQRQPSLNALENVVYDWHLPMPLLQDTDTASTAGLYGVLKVPTTFLIGKDLHLLQRWDGLVLAAPLALRLQHLIGESARAGSIS